MKHHTQKRARRRVLPLFLLALFCVGAVELAACRFCEPPLYQRITAPVRCAWRLAAATAVQAGSSLADLAVQAGSSLADLAGQAGAALTALTQAREEETSLDDPDAGALGGGDAQSDAAAQLASRDGNQVLTGGAIDLIYYNQEDPAWASGSYGTDPMDKYGCGPTAMAIVVSSLTQQQVTPAEMAQWAVENKHWAPRGGSYLSLVQGAAAAFGLSAQAYPTDCAENLQLELSAGHIFVALMSAGHFTSSGHFIVLRGITPAGEILVADPSSSERSLAPWDAQLIVDELSRSRHDGAPLWCLTVPGETG